MKLRFYGFLFPIFFVIISSAQEVSLEEAVQMGLQKNFDIRILRGTGALATNDNRFAFGAFLPQLNANGAYTKSNNDSKAITFADVATNKSGAKSTNTQGQIQLQWTLFDGTKMFATLNRIRELAILGQVNLRNQMINSTASIITTYYNIIRQKQQLKAIYELMAVSEERVKLAEKKLQVGTGGKPELLQAKVDLNAQRTAVLAQLTLIQQLKDQMNGLLGMGLPDVYDVTDTIPINLSLTLEETLEGIETSNQAVVAAKENIKVAELILRENRATRSPVISFVSAYNYGKNENELATSPFALKFNQNQGYNYGLAVTIPVLNNLNVNRLIAASKITIDRSKTIYNQQLSLAVVGVRNAFVNYDNAKKILAIEEENILLAKENVYIALEGFKRGNTLAIDLRAAQQSLADAYNLLIAARYNAKISETELLRLKGSLLN